MRGIRTICVNDHPDDAFPGAIENRTRLTKVAATSGVVWLAILTGRGEYDTQRGEE